MIDTTVSCALADPAVGTSTPAPTTSPTTTPSTPALSSPVAEEALTWSDEFNGAISWGRRNAKYCTDETAVAKDRRVAIGTDRGANS
ncbi:hypothetical protein [Kitasatospora sp. NPDC006786]|uniref:hypothetical protein n=1 Tax=unclassified Kitasatospora TaxID=2633591 RepID=UPI0033EEE216